jgi:type IV pilus assembly protein PilO
MDLQQLNELDFSNIGDWPGLVKGIIVLLLCALLVGAWYYFDTQKQLGRLETTEAREQELRSTFEVMQKKAAKLDDYKQQLAEMRESFGAMLRQLPDKTEVAALLVDVSQTGLAAGLEFELFRPSGEIPKDFYAELPINIRVTGAYHEFGNFISGLAALPRIVTLHNISIVPRSKGRGKKDEGRGSGKENKETLLLLTATAKTYRYLEEGAQ